MARCCWIDYLDEKISGRIGDPCAVCGTTPLVRWCFRVGTIRLCPPYEITTYGMPGIRGITCIIIEITTILQTRLHLTVINISL